MSILKDLFGDVVDIVSVPVKVVAKVTDDIIGSNVEEYVEEIKDTVKGKDEMDKVIEILKKFK